MPVLTFLDTLAVQGFVFASNRLADVAGASLLVDWATLPETLREGLRATPGGRLIMAAGGNALLRFDDLAAARGFAGWYTRELLDRAPGLEVAIAHQPYADGELASGWLTLRARLAGAKARRRPSAAPPGLGVNAVCRDTGAPAVELDGRDGWAPRGALVERARACFDERRGRWDRLLGGTDGPLPGGRLDFPRALDKLREDTGERSLMGVVHVDGNGVGARIEEWLRRRVAEATPDRQVEDECQQWSAALTSAVERAMAAVAGRVRGALTVTAEGRVAVTGRAEELEFPLVTEREAGAGQAGQADPAGPAGPGTTVWLPLRPILLGGDDLTFVCDGRVALDLAVTAANAFGTPIPHLSPEPLSACAGVAIVPLRTPFSRAYRLADRLCSSAKRAAREGSWPAGAVDWHVGPARPGEPVEAIRARQYRSVAGSGAPDLTCRPYRLDHVEGEVSWPWLEGTLLGAGATGLRGPVWAAHRAKAQALAMAAREGADAVKGMLNAWHQRLGDTGLRLPPLIPHGYARGRTPLLDAVELLDRAQVLDPARTAGKPEEERRPA